MFALVVALAAISQAPECVAGYTPKVGDKVVLARDEPGRKVPIVKNAGAAMGFRGIVECSNEAEYRGHRMLIWAIDKASHGVQGFDDQMIKPGQRTPRKPAHGCWIWPSAEADPTM